jgi:hypothetical protein
MIATDVGSAALILGKCCSSIINLVQTGPLMHGRLAMVERRSGLEDPILGESARRSRTTGDWERNVFEQALEIWSGDPQ